MVVAAHPLVAGQSIGVVVVVQVLKLKVRYHGVIVHCAVHVDAAYIQCSPQHT